MEHPAIIDEFLQLARTESHSKDERRLADALKAKLEALGFEVAEDATGAKIGGNTGSLVARLAGDPAKTAVLFSAHMDRVDNHGHINPVVDEAAGVIRSDGTSILGADDAAGAAAILDGVRRALAEKIPRGDIEVVFTVSEEIGLLGSRHLDYSRLKARAAYVVDSGGPVGTITNAAPSGYNIDIAVRGRSAHAGLEPEKGLNALKVLATALAKTREGRLSPRSTANFAVITAGRATNIVCDLARLKGEARSTSETELQAYLKEVRAVFSGTCADMGAGLEMECAREYPAFHVGEGEMAVRLARAAMATLGLPAQVAPTGGGSDANFFNENGIPAVLLSTGYAFVHTSQEEQPIGPLVTCGRLVTEIIREAGK